MEPGSRHGHCAAGKATARLLNTPATCTRRIIDPTLFYIITSWSFDPLIMVGLGLYAVFYLRGMLRLRRYGGFARQIGSGRLTAAIAGWFVLVLALLSPVSTFSGYLLSAHMVQHVLLMQVAAVLLLIGRPVPTLMLGLPRSIARSLAPLAAKDGPLYPIGSFVTSPLPSLSIYLVVFLGWHLPFLYNAAVENVSIHYLEHLTFFGAAMLFWWPAIDPLSGRARKRRYLSLITQFVGFLAANLLGILLAFNADVIYSSYLNVPRLFGVSAIDDQIAAGLVMWVAGGPIFLVTMLATLAAANADQEAAQRRLEERADAFAP